VTDKLENALAFAKATAVAVHASDSKQAKIAELEAEIAELEDIVDKLPTTADGVPVVPGMEIWHPDGRTGTASIAYYGRGCFPSYVVAEYCYSTREAAEAAKEKQP